MSIKSYCFHLFFIVMITACSNTKTSSQSTKENGKAANWSDQVKLPDPYATPAVRNNSKVIGWPENKTPVAPTGFTVTKFITGAG
jgi:hypothetical protein